MTKLIIGLPSKGRLQENALSYFKEAGMPVKRPGGARNYRGMISSLQNAEIAFLSASEIAGELEAGHIHLGITGEDLLHEKINDLESKVEVIDRLDFGYADVVVAVPDAWIDVQTIADLADVAYEIHENSGRRMRVATKYIQITQRYFAKHGVTDYQIVESLGATEGTPAAGTADIITDITTTGSTLRANALRPLKGPAILSSQATLTASLTASWGDDEQLAASELLNRIFARATARDYSEIDVYGVTAQDIDTVLSQNQSTASLLKTGENTCTLLAQKQSVFTIVSDLRDHGMNTALVRDASFIFTNENVLLDRLKKRIAKPS